MHCRKGAAQPVPKTAHRNGYRDKRTDGGLSHRSQASEWCDDVDVMVVVVRVVGAGGWSRPGCWYWLVRSSDAAAHHCIGRCWRHHCHQVPHWRHLPRSVSHSKKIWGWGCCSDKYGSGVVPNMSHCQITRSTRFARQVGIIKPNSNPTTNPNPNPNPN